MTAAAEIFAVTLSPGVAVVLADSLDDIAPAALEAALPAIVRQSGAPVTKPADLALRLRAATGVAAPSPAETERAAELAAWEEAVAWVRRYAWRLRSPVTGVLGWDDPSERRGLVPPLPPRVEGALRRAGGPDAIYRNLDQDSLAWVKRDFSEGYRLAESIQKAHWALAAAPGGVAELVGGVARALSAGRSQ